MSDHVLSDFARAIERNDLTLINSMLSNRDVDANALFPTPALIFAAMRRRPEVVDLLLKAGARIDDVDALGRSACHTAAMAGAGDVMHVLLAHRPNLALKDKYKKTALEYSISHGGELSIALALIDAGSPRTSSDLCNLAASTSAVQALMDRGVVIRDLRTDFGETPLHLAAVMDDIDLPLLSMLINCGVDLEARTGPPSTVGSLRKSCTEIVVSRSHVAALRLFLLAGADVNGIGDCLLHKSIEWHQRELETSNAKQAFTVLLAAGADVEARDSYGRTALLWAARPLLMWFVHAMLAAGADLDVADFDGETPRRWLAESGLTVDPDRVEAARREIARARLDFVRHRALQVCIGLQSLELDALQMCEILVHACGPLAPLISFHHWWAIATTVKHFKR
jgi:ankyrin repeat protein